MTEHGVQIDTRAARIKLQEVAEIERGEGAKKLSAQLQKLLNFLNRPDNKVKPEELTALAEFGNFLDNLVPPVGTDQEREAEITDKLATVYTQTSHKIDHQTFNNILQEIYRTLKAEVIIYGGYVQANDFGQKLMEVAYAVRDKKERENLQPEKTSLISRVTKKFLGV